MGGPSLIVVIVVVVVVVRLCRPHPTRRPHCRHRCRRRCRPFVSSTSNKEASYSYGMPAERNLAASSYVTVVGGVGDAIRTPQRRCHCRRRAAISTVAYPRYPPGADPGHACACPAPLTSRHRRRRLLVHVRASTSLALAANDDTMPSILSRSSTSDESAPQRTEEIIPLPSMSFVVASPLPLLPPFPLISTPPCMVPKTIQTTASNPLANNRNALERIVHVLGGSCNRVF